LLLVAQRAQEAEALFARLEQDFPHSQYASEATLRRAEQALADGQPELAEQRLADFDCTAVPGELAQRALYVRGRAAQARGQWDAAETSLAALRERYPQCELAPTAAYLLGEIAYRRGKYPLAAERMAALNTSPDGPPQPWAATAELRRAQALAQEKKWDEAFDVARQIPDRFPHFADVHEVDYLIGRAKAAQADFDAARAAYAKVLASPAGAKSQTGALAQWMLGESYFHQENYPSALAEYAKLDERHPFPRLQAAALLQAAKCHEHLQQWPQAVASYEQLLAKYPESEWCSEAKGLLREARSRLAGGTPRRQ
jgi:TolA-binding protein